MRGLYVIQWLAMMLAFVTTTSPPTEEYDPIVVFSTLGGYYLLPPSMITDDISHYILYLPFHEANFYTLCGAIKKTESGEEYVYNVLHEKNTFSFSSNDQMCILPKTSIKKEKDDEFVKVYGIGYTLEAVVSAKKRTNPESNAKLHHASETDEMTKKSKDEKTLSLSKIPDVATKSENNEEFPFLVVIKVYIGPNHMSKVVIFKYLYSNKEVSTNDTSGEYFNPDEKEYGEIKMNDLYNERKDLVKQQLAPASYFFKQKWKASTYHDLNTSAMRKVYAPKWQSIVQKVRMVANWLDKPWIFTGTLVTDEENVEYLDSQQRFPIPNIFWTAIVHQIGEETYQGMLIVMENDDRNVQSKICNDICVENHWFDISNDERNIVPYTYCCPLTKEIALRLKVPTEEIFTPNVKISLLDLSGIKIHLPYKDIILSAELNIAHRGIANDVTVPEKN